MMCYSLYYRKEIAAAHKLIRHPGKCKNLHGHNWKVEVWLSATRLDKQNMVVDFGKVKQTVNKLDHTYLNEKMGEEQPTCEFIAGYLVKELLALQDNIEKVKVRVWEDENSYAEVEKCKD